MVSPVRNCIVNRKVQLVTEDRKRWPGRCPAADVTHIPLLISSVIFLASPKSIMVLSRQKRVLSMPA